MDFHVVTSLANGPATTPDSRDPPRSYYCASHVFITSWLTALGTMLAMCQFHLPRLQVTNHCEQQRDANVGQKLNLTALIKHTDFHYGAFLCDFDASSFSIRGMPAECALRRFSSHPPHLKSAFTVCWSDILTRDRLMMGIPFLTFNMEVSFFDRLA